MCITSVPHSQIKLHCIDRFDLNGKWFHSKCNENKFISSRTLVLAMEELL